MQNVSELLQVNYKTSSFFNSSLPTPVELIVAHFLVQECSLSKLSPSLLTVHILPQGRCVLTTLLKYPYAHTHQILTYSALQLSPQHILLMPDFPGCDSLELSSKLPGEDAQGLHL